MHMFYYPLQPATCGDSDPSKPGTPFNCLLFGMFYDPGNADKPASMKNCCVSDADVNNRTA